jgi:hypothetical protein
MFAALLNYGLVLSELCNGVCNDEWALSPNNQTQQSSLVQVTCCVLLATTARRKPSVMMDDDDDDVGDVGDGDDDDHGNGDDGDDYDDHDASSPRSLFRYLESKAHDDNIGNWRVVHLPANNTRSILTTRPQQ